MFLWLWYIFINEFTVQVCCSQVSLFCSGGRCIQASQGLVFRQMRISLSLWRVTVSVANDITCRISRMIWCWPRLPNSGWCFWHVANVDLAILGWSNQSLQYSNYWGVVWQEQKSKRADARANWLGGNAVAGLFWDQSVDDEAGTLETDCGRLAKKRCSLGMKCSPPARAAVVSQSWWNHADESKSYLG